MTFSRNAEIYGESEPAIMFTRLSAGVQTYNFRGRPAPDRRLPFSGEVFGLELGAHQQFSAEAIDKCAERSPLATAARALRLWSRSRPRQSSNRFSRG
jgi:hypothetical protein